MRIKARPYRLTIHHAVSAPLLAALLALGYMGCATSPQEETPPAGALYHHNWWNYYERGLKHLDLGYADEARLDFERALGLRPGARFGRDEESWRARTYGVAVIDGYFPKRELGVALYELGDWGPAARMLQESLNGVPSARASYYLNLANRKLLSAETSLPVIELDAGSTSRWTSARARVLTGQVTAAGKVAGLSIQGQDELIELAENTRAFRRSVPLQPGTLEITVIGRDLTGQASRTSVWWQVDWVPPQMLLQTIAPANGGLEIRGRVVDDQGLQMLALSGSQPASPPAPGAQSQDFSVVLKPGQPVLVEATDLAGNRFARLLKHEELSQAMLRNDDAHLLAQAAAEGRADTPAPMLPASTEIRSDRLKPTLFVVAEATLVQDDPYYLLEGRAEDAGGIRSINLEGEELLADISKPARFATFARTLQLEQAPTA